MPSVLPETAHSVRFTTYDAEGPVVKVPVVMVLDTTEFDRELFDQQIKELSIKPDGTYERVLKFVTVATPGSAPMVFINAGDTLTHRQLLADIKGGLGDEVKVLCAGFYDAKGSYFYEYSSTLDKAGILSEADSNVYLFQTMGPLLQNTGIRAF